ncbi:MAG: ABC transporter substrate-binding protein [Clostridiaceae bacterium]
MKKNRIAQLLAVMLCAMLLLTTVGCKTSEPAKTTEEEAAATEAPVVVLPDVPADRYDATVTPRTGNNATTPLVISSSTLDGKFSPFFATSAYDVTVEGMTQLGLLYLDKMGSPQAGVEFPCLAYSYTQDVSDDKSTSTYQFVLKNGITFSDGTPITAKDVLFTIYTLCDPLYDGSSTFYALDVQGLSEYRLQTSAEALAVADAIVAAGIATAEDGTMSMPAADGATAEQQAAFWAYLDQAGEEFAQEIVDYVSNNYLSDDYVQGYFSPDLTAEQVKASPFLTVAFGMGMWVYGSYADGKFTDALGNVYDETTGLTVKDYWTNILTTYGYDLSDAGINYEKAGDMRIEDYVRDLYIANDGAVAGGVASISGITTGTVTGEDGVDREYIQIVINGIDPTAIFKMGVEVAPMHYYTDGFTGTLNEYGVSMNDPAFMELLKTKNVAPLGAGPYVFEKYEDNVVYYTANDSYLLGSPKIENFRIQVIESGSELDSALTGVVHYTDPSASTAIINDITAAQGDYAKLSYTLVDNDGYGYIGINAQYFPEWQARKAIASTFNTELCISDYYGELATVNYRTMTKIQWAYPENPENLFPYDGTGETAKALFLEAGYVYDEATNIMSYPATSDKAGEQVTIKATLPMDAANHPAGSVLINAQAVLATIGVKLDIEVDDTVLNKLSTAYESGIQVWAAAWGSGGQDPDMFQVWYSDPDVNQGTSPAAKGLYWLFANGSDDQKAALVQLNALIDAGRSTLDTEERKTIYAEALEISTSLATEIPTYQRKNMFVYNKEVINADTLFSGEDVTPFQSPISFIWNVELNG